MAEPVKTAEVAREVLREMLLALAAKKGAPSLSEISRRLGHDRNHLTRLLNGRGGALTIEAAVAALEHAGGRPEDYFAAIAKRLGEPAGRQAEEQDAVEAFLKSINDPRLNQIIDKQVDEKLKPIKRKLGMD